MIPAKSEFPADLLLYVLVNEPELPLYLGLCVSVVKPANDKEDAKVTTLEIADPSYLRQPAAFTAPEAGFLKLTHNIQFPRATNRWDRVTHFAVYDAPKGGNMLLLKPTGGVTNVDAGEIVAIMASEFLLYVGHSVVSPLNKVN